MTIKAGAGIYITGVKELDKALNGLERKLQSKALRKATRAIAKQVATDARRIVSEDTGDIAASIKVRSAATTYSKDGKRKRIASMRGMVGHGVVAGEGLFKGDAFYAGFLEFGTKERYTRHSGAYRGRLEQTQHAFLRPALYGNQHLAQQQFRAEISAFIQQQKAQRAKR